MNRFSILTRLRLAVLLALCLALLLGGSLALAQVGGGYDLSWWTIGGGGGTGEGGGYALSGTIGQSDAGALTGGPYTLSGGFWPGGGPPPANGYKVFLPLAVR